MASLISKDEFMVVISFLNVQDLCLLSLCSKKLYQIVNKNYVFYEQCLNYGKNLLKLSYKPPPIEQIMPKFDDRNWKLFLRKMKRNLFVNGSNIGPNDWGVDKMPKEKDYGQLGFPCTEFINNITLVPFFIGKNVKEISCGGFHTLVLTDDDELYSFGSNAFGQLGLDDRKSRDIPTKINIKNVKSIACGYAFSAVITNDGKLITWGFNKNGRCGHPDDYNEYTEESKMPFISSPKIVEQFDGIILTDMACGSGHMIVLDDKGQAYSFGRNDLGQLAVFDPERDVIPDRFILNLKHNNKEYEKRKLRESNITKIACTAYSTLIMEKDQKISIYQLHNKLTTKIQKAGIVKGGGFFCFSESGFLLDYEIPWDRDDRGWNGLMNNIKDIATSHSHFMAIKNDGSLYFDRDDQVIENVNINMKVPIVFERVECGHAHNVLIGDLKMFNV